MNPPSTDGMPRRLVIGYGLPGLVTAVPVIPIAILLPTYYAQDLGLGFTITGLALGLARILDFFTDILVGIGIDRLVWPWRKAKHLKFKPWIAVGAIIAALGLCALATPVTFDSDWLGGLYLGLFSCVLFLGWTLMMVPYTAWGALLATTLHGRSSLTIAREAFGLTGMLLALSAPLVLLDTDLNPIALVAYLSIGLGVPIIIYTLKSVPDASAGEPERHAQTVNFRDVRALLAYAPFRFTIVCWFLNSLANGLPAVLFPIVVQQYLGFDEKSLFALLFLYFGAGVLAAPLWLALAKKLGKMAAWQSAILLNIIVFSSVLLLEPKSSGFFSPQLFYWICTLSGMSLAADMALPASIQADVMEADRT
ncbi:MAG: MFS transporter, partial [Pseudomonadota bacterium]